MREIEEYCLDLLLNNFASDLWIVVGSDRQEAVIMGPGDINHIVTQAELLEALPRLLNATTVAASRSSSRSGKTNDDTGIEHELVTAKEGAGLFRVSRFTFDKWSKTDGFPSAFKIGMVKRWTRSELVKWFDTMRL